MNNKCFRERIQLYHNNRDLCEQKYGPLKFWDVSNVTNISFCNFREKDDTSFWDTAKVKEKKYFSSNVFLSMDERPNNLHDNDGLRIF